MVEIHRLLGLAVDLFWMPRVSVPLQPPQSWNYELSDPSLEKKVGRNGIGLCVCVCVQIQLRAGHNSFEHLISLVGVFT
jgi:hypothetical protein